MYQDDELVMLSSLQHYQFCKRQCALIHLEGVWEDNFLTASGKVLHKHVDSGFHETRSNLHIATSLRLVSREFGLTGVADLVEFHACDKAVCENGCVIATSLPGKRGFWKPYPVEYKRGKPKTHRADEVQLCAQALCLEEMLHVTIFSGALFYGENRRRTEVSFDNELRSLTKHIASKVHELLDDGELPPAILNDSCEACSIVNSCCPKRLQRNFSVDAWIDKNIEEITKN